MGLGLTLTSAPTHTSISFIVPLDYYRFMMQMWRNYEFYPKKMTHTKITGI